MCTRNHLDSLLHKIVDSAKIRVGAVANRPNL
jgi:hypothetical protein